MNIYHAFRNAFCVMLALLQHIPPPLQRNFVALPSDTYFITVISNSSQQYIDLRGGITGSAGGLLNGRPGFDAGQ